MILKEILSKLAERQDLMIPRNWKLPYETVPDLKPWTAGIYDSST